MSASTQLPEGDLAAPATTGQLLLVKTQLEGKIDGATAELNAKIEGVRSDLRIELREVRLGMNRTMWLGVATLGAVGIMLNYF